MKTIALLTFLHFLTTASGLLNPSYPVPLNSSLSNSTKVDVVTAIVTQFTTICPSSIQATPSTAKSVSSLPSAAVSLLPCVHDEHDGTAYSNMLPSKNLTTYYQSESGSAAFVSLSNLRYPTVILEHIDYVVEQTCSGDVLHIKFMDAQSFQFAVQTWSESVTTGLVFLIYCPTCGSSHPSDRAWMLVHDITFDLDTLTISCQATEITIDDIGSTVQIALGSTTVASSSPMSTGVGKSTSKVASTLSQATSVSTGSGTLPSVFVSTVSPSISFSTSKGSPASSLTQISGSNVSPPSATQSFSSNDLDFDVALDNQLGYLDPNSAGFWAQLLPGVTGLDTTQFSNPDKRKRALNVAAIADTLTTAAGNYVASAGNAISSYASGFVNSVSAAFTSATKTTVAAIVKSLNSLSPFSLGPISFNAFPNTLVSTPFGKGVKLFDKLPIPGGGTTNTVTIFCIHCGASGGFTLSGMFIFEVDEGLKVATLDISGQMLADFNLAFISKGVNTIKDTSNVFEFPIEGYQIGKWLKLGPSIKLDVEVALDLSGGGIEVGYAVSWPNIDIKLDLLNPSRNTHSGFTPTRTPNFDFTFSKNYKASAALPLSLDFSVELLGGKFTIEAKVVDKPQIEAKADLNLYKPKDIDAQPEGAVLCGGVMLTEGFQNALYAEVKFVPFVSAFKSLTVDLGTYLTRSSSTCLGIDFTVHHTPVTAAPLPVVSCGYADSDEPDNDGDEDTVCVTIGSKAALLKPSGTITDFTAATCDPALDDNAYLVCERSAQASIISYESNAVAFQAAGLARRDVGATAAPTITPAPAPFKAIRRAAPLSQSRIVDVDDASLFLSWADDGNLIVDNDDTRSSFATSNGFVVGDTAGRLLHLYEPMMKSVGVSRLRLASLEMMPVGSVLVTLVSIEVGNKKVLVAMTSAGDTYFPVTCLYDEPQFPKVFLAKDLSGLQTLVDPNLNMTVTGGTVTQCGAISWSE